MQMTLPKEKQDLLNAIVSDISTVDGVQAIVLGGSFATGTATAKSDIDIGIYYLEKKPFNVEEIRTIAQKYSDNEQPTVTDFYEWGPWVNGGAWIKTAHGDVDFLYKNIEQITSTIANAKNGIWENHFEQQPPFGFSSIFFLAETQCCVPLYEVDNVIQKLKTEVAQYPEKLKKSVIQQSLWSAEFTIWHAHNFVEKQDMYNIVGCLTRALKSIVTALFAINELYPIGDKRAIELLEKASVKPSDVKKKIEKIVCVDKDAPKKNIALLQSLWLETINCTNGEYKSFYNL